MILDTTTRSLEVLLAGSVTANQLQIVASWTDLATGSATSGATPSLTNNTTAVTVVAAPSSGTQRNVYAVSIFNADTVAATATVRYNDNGTYYKIVTVTIQPGHTLNYTDVNSWQILTSAGYVATTSSTTYLPATVVSGVNSQTGTTYTPGLGDAGNVVECTNASAITVTIPPNSSTAFPIGTFMFFKQGGGGVVTISPGSGVTVNAANGSTTSSQHDARGVVKLATDTWVLL